MLSALFGACESLVDDLSNLPKVASKLTVECYISPQSELIKVRVTESQPLLGAYYDSTPFIKDAMVVLSSDAGQVTVPFDTATNTYILARNQFKIDPGKRYTLTVSDKKRKVTAHCTVPLNVTLFKSYDLDTLIDHRQDSVIRGKVYWKDIAGEINYYTVRGRSNIYEDQIKDGKLNHTSSWSLLGLNYQYPLSNDLNLDASVMSSPYFYIDLPRHHTLSYLDSGGKLQTVDSNPNYTIDIEILNIDENYYRFYQSLQDNNINPFSEPSIMYSNIEGGIGCFGAYNLLKTTIKP
jgi:hypothetical protein